MEDQAKQALADLLERAVSGVDQAVEFSQAQIPDVVEQLLLWHMVDSVLTMAIPMLFTLCVFAFFCKNFKDMPNQESRDKDGLPPFIPSEYWTRHGDPTARSVFLVFIPGVFSALGMVVSAITMNLDWLQILIAPKLYLLEYAADLVK